MADVLIGKEAKPIGLVWPRAFACMMIDWTTIGATGASLVYLLQFVDS